MFEKLEATIKSLELGFDGISEDRKALLDELSIYIKGKLTSHQEVHLVFICTHNSRRSHMAQIWANAAAMYYDIDNIFSYSGGTQKTSFHHKAVKALKKAGFKIKAINETSNPKYKVKYGKKEKPLICFSKKYQHKSNPQNDFVAVMTCSDADESCPIVSGAEYRTSITYEDPKTADGTKEAENAYEARSRQIGTEMLYVFKRVSSL